MPLHPSTGNEIRVDADNPDSITSMSGALGPVNLQIPIRMGGRVDDNALMKPLERRLESKLRRVPLTVDI